MNVITRAIIGITILACSGSAAAIMITGTVDDVTTEFYQEDIWQIISEITPDTRAERKLLSKSDRKFVKRVGKLQKRIIKLEDKAATRGLKEKQANRLQKNEERLVEMLNSRGLLNDLVLSGLNNPGDIVNNDWPNGAIFGDESRGTPPVTAVSEPSSLALLALGLICAGVSRGKRKRL